MILIRLAQPNKTCAPLALAIEKALARHPGSQPSVPEREGAAVAVNVGHQENTKTKEVSRSDGSHQVRCLGNGILVAHYGATDYNTFAAA